jgi:hypothetical protein
MMMGADLYETEDEISRLLAEGKVPIGVGENTKIRWALGLNLDGRRNKKEKYCVS